MENSKIICAQCNKTFHFKKNLYAHSRKMHNIELVESKVKNYTCKYCDRKYTNKNYLTRHTREVHDVKTSTVSSRIICPYDSCEENLSSFVKLISHLSEIHQIVVEVDEFIFDTIFDFETWKRGVEEQTVSSYVKDTSEKQLHDESTKKYLHCHRSLNYRKKGNDVRATKSIGTNKINKCCPSRMEVITRDCNGFVQINVKFWKTHCGHAHDVRRIRLDRKTKSMLGGVKVDQGVTWEHILDEIRDGATLETQQQQSLILQRKDLLSKISKDFNIHYPTRRHKDDAMSVALWVKDMQSLGEDSPVIYYKPQDVNDENSCLGENDFALIIMNQFQAQQLIEFGPDKVCIDSTHGTNAYNFQLHTFMTIDEYGEGCPVAYCFSNRTDETVLKLFFHRIKLKVGIINSEIFMSDDEPAFYNAWKIVMGTVSHRWLCTWHVDRNWRNDLSKITGESTKKLLVYKTLRVLMQIKSVDEFKLCQKQIIDDLLDDEDTRQFGLYFQQYYSNRSEVWAHCYRLKTDINTNMYLEALHNDLKHVYVEGNKYKRLDKTINAILKITRNMTLKRLLDISENAITFREKSIHESHEQSKLIASNSIRLFENGKSWIVKSLSNKSQEYYVVKEGEICDSPCLKCSVCKVCVHTFTCTCTDNLIKMNICEHIHACAREFYKPVNDDVCNNNVKIDTEADGFEYEIWLEEDILEEEEEKEEEFILIQNSAESKLDKYKNIVHQADLMKELCFSVELSDEEIKSVERLLGEALDIMNKSRKNSFKINENVNAC